MSTDELIADGESLTVEFKRRLGGDQLAQAVACLANGHGGTLLIGVDDDGTPVGATGPDGGPVDPAKMAAFIQNKTEPPLPVAVHVDEVRGEQVARIEVPRADPGPVGTRLGQFTRRALDARGEPGCVPMTAHEIVSMGMVTRGQDYAAAPARDASTADLDPLEFDRFRRMCQDAGDPYGNLSDDDILRALGLVPRSEAVSLGSLLLFGRPEAIRRWIPAAELLFQDSRSGMISNERMIGGLLWAAERVHDLLDVRANVTELYVGIHRVDIPLIPTITRREAVANALVHRDYAELGPTRVELTEEEFVVSSFGGLPPGVTIQNILVESRPRSPILAEAFRRAGLVERRGKGVNEMFEGQLRAGRDAPDYSWSTDSSVTVSVALGTSDLDLVRFLIAYEDTQQMTFGLGELRLVHEIRASGSASPTELADALHIPVATVRSAAGRLIERGIVESRGQGRSRQFHLTARFYDLAQDRSAYVRLKGADPLQQERMVLDYVGSFGHITRSLAAELCQVTPVQARTLLKRLVDEEKLILIGERRAARYTLPE